MGLFDWITGKRSEKKLQRPTRPEVKELGEYSLFVAYEDNDSMVLVDRDTFDYQYGESKLPDPAQRDLDDLLPKITRVRALSGGIFRGEALESAVLLDIVPLIVIHTL